MAKATAARQQTPDTIISTWFVEAGDSAFVSVFWMLIAISEGFSPPDFAIACASACNTLES
jgi:hypothetical protein